MERFEFDDVELTYRIQGGGDRVVLVHAAAFASWYGPLLELLPDLSTLWYRRRLAKPAEGGYRPLTVAEDAVICRRLLDHVGWDVAHVVGHSYGALVGLQLALDAPERVGSVALLEPAARGVSSSEAVVAALQPVIAAYRAGDTAGAVDRFLTHVCGAGYREPLERTVPGAFGQAVAEADLFFQAEMPAVQHWSFGPSEAARIGQPVLNVLGARSEPRFVEGSTLVQSWFPQAQRLEVPDAGHLLMVENAPALAHGLREHLARHPLGGRAADDTVTGPFMADMAPNSAVRSAMNG
jgi:pimeloyl-ACP methyl ester carboxylesterase